MTTDSVENTPVNESNEAAAYFKANRYVQVDAALPEDICAFLTDHMLKLADEQLAKADTQCPLSPAIYGDKLFDTLLNDLKPTIEKVTGLRLNPTYSYARKYLPGDELHPHLDRPACEISATLTLGHSGDVWPIHVSRDDTVENDIGEIVLPVGSLIVYRGMEINHWREKYTQGNWQCQVFLHYVDADGPHAELKYDGRSELGLPPTRDKIANIEQLAEDGIPRWTFGILNKDKYLYTTKQNLLSKPLIESIIGYGQGKLNSATVVSKSRGIIDKSIRNVSHCWLPFNQFDWLYRLLENEIKDMNWLNFKFNLTHMEQIDYLEYHAGASDVDKEHGHGKYVKHVDGSLNSTRKLSFSILLSDPSEFEGGDLLIWNGNDPYVVEKHQGMITFFPSNVIHEVTPVTRGVRRSIVNWVHGPHFT